MLVPDPQSVHSNVGLLHVGHAQSNQAGPLLYNVDSVSGEQGLVVKEELKLRLRYASDKSSEMSAGGGGADAANAVERPRPSDAMYQRQASFRGLGQLSGNTPFKRGGKGHTSLRINDLPSTRDRLALHLGQPEAAGNC